MKAELSPEVRAQLVQLHATPRMWNAVVDLMEELCVVSETEFFQQKPNDEKSVLAAHNTLRAQRVFFERFQSEVQRLASVIGVQEAPAPKLSEEQLKQRVIDRTMSPIEY